MSPAAAVTLIVFAVLIALRKPILRVVALLFVRRAVRGALADVGKTALAKSVDHLTLVPDSASSWKDAAIETHYVRPLRDAGFVSVGPFSVQQMPGVRLHMLVHPGDRVQANVYEHPRAGGWLELVCRYEDGKAFTVTDLPSRGIDTPPWITTRRVEPKTPVTAMLRCLMEERRSTGLDSTTPANAREQFEQGYARCMDWKKNKGVSANEVARQIPRFLDSKAERAAEEEPTAGRS